MHDVSNIGVKIPSLFSFWELDVTELRKKINVISDKNDQKITLTNYLLFCYIQTIKQNIQVQGIKSWWNWVVNYEDIDVCIPIELANKTVDPKIIRKANTKSIFEIREEIVKTKKNKKVRLDFWQKWFLFFPYFIRKIGYSIVLSTPLLRKRIFGTAYFSSLHLPSSVSITYKPIPIHPIGMFVGSIQKREILINGKIEIREIIPITTSVDHRINDGVFLHDFVNVLHKKISVLIDEL